MHVTIVHTAIDMSRIDDAVEGIEAVKQRLTGLPGFTRAFWFEPLEGRGLMVSLWGSEDAARQAAPAPGFSPAPGVIVDRVEVRGVIAEA